MTTAQTAPAQHQAQHQVQRTDQSPAMSAIASQALQTKCLVQHAAVNPPMLARAMLASQSKTPQQSQVMALPTSQMGSVPAQAGVARQGFDPRLAQLLQTLNARQMESAQSSCVTLQTTPLSQGKGKEAIPTHLPQTSFSGGQLTIEEMARRAQLRAQQNNQKVTNAIKPLEANQLIPTVQIQQTDKKSPEQKEALQQQLASLITAEPSANVMHTAQTTHAAAQIPVASEMMNAPIAETPKESEEAVLNTKAVGRVSTVETVPFTNQDQLGFQGCVLVNKNTSQPSVQVPGQTTGFPIPSALMGLAPQAGPAAQCTFAPVSDQAQVLPLSVPMTTPGPQKRKLPGDHDDLFSAKRPRTAPLSVDVGQAQITLCTDPILDLLDLGVR